MRVMNVTILHRAEPLSNGIWYLVSRTCQGDYYTKLLFRVSILHYLGQLYRDNMLDEDVISSALILE